MYIIKNYLAQPDTAQLAKMLKPIDAPEVRALAAVFSKKIKKNCLSQRANHVLAKNHCKNVGDLYYFLVENNCGKKTQEELFWCLIYSFMETKNVMENRAAFFLSHGVTSPDDMREVVEVCPECESENILLWNPEKMGYVARCRECGVEMFLCDECRHAEDNPGMECNWQISNTADSACSGECFRGKCYNGQE